MLRVVLDLTFRAQRLPLHGFAIPPHPQPASTNPRVEGSRLPEPSGPQACFRKGGEGAAARETCM